MQSLRNSYIGDYRLTDFLGAGGMGEVYRAVHSKINRVVAVKVLTGFDPNTRYGDRFINEARIQAGLSHSNIATLYDFVEHQGRPCIIMEYVDGQTLHDMIRANGPFKIENALEIFQSVVQAIAYLHSKKILHRDIKSNNIKISTAGQVKILDFGIAKDTVTPRLTLDGHYVGSLHYLSPEQVMGKPVDPRADIWSLGILFYEMVTGCLPFESRSLDELYKKIKTADHISFSSIHPPLPDKVIQIIDRCLKQKPSQRFSSAEELIHAVTDAGGSLTAPLAQGFEKINFSGLSGLGDFLRENKVLVAAGVFFVLMIATGFFLGSLNTGGTLASSSPEPVAGSQNIPVETPARERRSKGMTRIKIDTFGGHAQVYVRNQLIGQTPYIEHFPAGSKVEICLKRKGFQDRVIQFEVGEIDSQYSYSLTKALP